MGRPKVIGAWVWDRRVPCKTVDRPVPLASSGRKHVGQLGVGVSMHADKSRRAKGFTLAADTVMTLMVKRQVALGELE